MRKPARNVKELTLPRKMAIAMVVACVVLVAVNAIALIFFRDEVVAKRKMEGMAREYYENYLYDKFSRENLEKYGNRGLPATTLRVLLSYDNARNADQEPYFQRTGCNMVETDVVFHPVEPYGRRDYEMQINYSCNFE